MSYLTAEILTTSSNDSIVFENDEWDDDIWGDDQDYDSDEYAQGDDVLDVMVDENDDLTMEMEYIQLLIWV